MRLLFIDFMIPYLFDDGNYPVGGWAVELRSWLAGFSKIGVETAILTRRDASVTAEATGETHLLRVYRPRGSIPGVAYLFGFLPDMIAETRKYAPTVLVQAVAGVNTGLFWMLSRIVSVPFVYRCANDIDVDQRFRDRLSRIAAFFFELGFTRADAYVAQNTYQLDAIRRRFPGKPAIVLHNPIQVSKSRVPPGRSARTHIAWLGVFQEQKNLPLLARIAEALPDVPFHIGGRLEIGMTHEPTLAALKKLESLPNVTFVGYVKRTEISTFLAGAVLLLSTSHYEGFSNTFLEAWSAGTPAVVPEQVDPDGLIASRGLGRVFRDGDDPRTVIGEVVRMPAADYEVLSATCRRHVETHHDPERLASAFVDFLETSVVSAR